MSIAFAEPVIQHDRIRTSTARAGKYLTFHLAEETYGIDILKVREIIGLMRITRIPGSAGHIRGVINLRGKVIPVIDLRRRFEMPPAEATEHTCVIVVDITTPTGTLSSGLVADSVSEVLDVMSENLEAASSLCSQQDTAYISGLAKSDRKVTILLDIDSLLTIEDVASMTGEGATGDGDKGLV